MHCNLIGLAESRVLYGALWLVSPQLSALYYIVHIYIYIWYTTTSTATTTTTWTKSLFDTLREGYIKRRCLQFCHLTSYRCTVHINHGAREEAWDNQCPFSENQGRSYKVPSVLGIWAKSVPETQRGPWEIQKEIRASEKPSTPNPEGCTKLPTDIASACHKFWRFKLLPPDTIASEPARCWHGVHTNQSFKAKKLLAWQEHLLRQNTSSSQQGDRILHSSNGGEQRIANHLVDGYDPTTRTVYEFHRCLWHGCPLCHPHPGRDKYSKLHPDRTLQEVYEATLAKHHCLREHGYHLVIKWEHEWDHEVKTNKELQQFLSTYECVEPLTPRDAFFGGHTNAVKLHHEIKEDEGEEIKYVDVTLLYPWVNKTQEYPVGHPPSSPTLKIKISEHTLELPKLTSFRLFACIILRCPIDMEASWSFPNVELVWRWKCESHSTTKNGNVLT